jgi:hypothetical protein
MVIADLLPRRDADAPRRTPRLRPRLWGELLVVLALVKIYDLVRGLANTREDEALGHGFDVLHLEARLHIEIDHPLNHWLVRSSLLTHLAAGWYQFIHLTVTLSVLALCWWFAPAAYRRARNSLVLINLVGLTVFWAYPVAPPRLLPGAGFFDASAMAGLGTGPAGPVSPNLYAAMPSLHLAWATWTVVVARILLKEHRVARRLTPVYATITAVVVVSTANHYVLDVVAGVAVGLASVYVTRLTGLPRRPSTPDRSDRSARSADLNRSSPGRGDGVLARPASDDPAAHEDGERARPGQQRRPDGDEAVGQHRGGGDVGSEAGGDEAADERDVQSAEATR